MCIMDEPIRRNWPVVPPTVEAGPGLRWAPSWTLWDDFWRKDELHEIWTTSSDCTGRAPSFYNPENVHATGYSLVLKATNEQPNLGTRAWYRNQHVPEHLKHRDYATSVVRSADSIRYGYFEICARVRRSQISSGVWLSNNENDGWWTGIDLFHYSTGRNDCYSNTLHTCTHVHRFGNDPFKKPLSRPKSRKFTEALYDRPHKYALDWTAQKITWLVDDIPIRTETNRHHHRPLYLKMDSQTFPTWFGLPTASENSKIPSNFEIFYVRTWKRYVFFLSVYFLFTNLPRRVPDRHTQDGITHVPKEGPEIARRKRRVSFRDY